MNALLKLVFGAGFNPLYVAIAAAVIFVAGVGTGTVAGWKVNGWRLGTQLEQARGEIKRIEAENAILRQANERCGIDVAEVRDAVKGVVDAGVAVALQAQAAMDRAAKTSAGHLGRAENILNRAVVPPEQQCDTIIKEQREYVEDRRTRRSK